MPSRDDAPRLTKTEARKVLRLLEIGRGKADPKAAAQRTEYALVISLEFLEAHCEQALARRGR